MLSARRTPGEGGQRGEEGPCWLNTAASVQGRPVLSDIWWPHIEPWFRMPRLPELMDGPSAEDDWENGGRVDPQGPVPTLDTVQELFSLGGGGGEVADAVRGKTSASLIAQLDGLLLDRRARQLEEVTERKKKVNALLKDPGLLIS